MQYEGVEHVRQGISRMYLSIASLLMEEVAKAPANTPTYIFESLGRGR